MGATGPCQHPVRAGQIPGVAERVRGRRVMVATPNHVEYEQRQ